MTADDIKLIGVMGSGVMGGGISQTFAQFGYQVIVRDLNDEILARSRDTIENGRFGIRTAVTRGLMSKEQADAAAACITYTSREEDLRDVDLLIEAIPERLELKQSEFGRWDKIVNPRAIFASNTSGYVIAELAQHVGEQRKPRFVGFHWFSPAPVMKVIETIYADFTAPDTTETMMELTRRIGKYAARVKDMPGTYGFVGNRVYAAMRREAQKIVDDGIATEEDIDAVMRFGRNWPVGPFNRGPGSRSGWQ